MKLLPTSWIWKTIFLPLSFLFLDLFLIPKFQRQFQKPIKTRMWPWKWDEIKDFTGTTLKYTKFSRVTTHFFSLCTRTRARNVRACWAPASYQAPFWTLRTQHTPDTDINQPYKAGIIIPIFFWGLVRRVITYRQKTEIQFYIQWNTQITLV